MGVQDVRWATSAVRIPQFRLDVPSRQKRHTNARRRVENSLVFSVFFSHGVHPRQAWMQTPLLQKVCLAVVWRADPIHKRWRSWWMYNTPELQHKALQP